jgi:Sortilin, neurotensin receptor 3,
VKDSEGNELICAGDCSLHLKGRTDVSSTSIYSSDNSPGLALGVGNTGMYLTQKDSEINTYLTRDGGHTWFEIRKGSHLYEIGDRGGIIVMARDDIAIKTIIYSWDEGLTWEELKVSEKAFLVANILTEPTNMELKFIIHGTYLDDA